ncbi:MAG: amidophosphoribosyltransferase [Alectoria sarmentosa]|nr:MAG: amidophosphoribosyltransferase [Alectoria sarmentosa]
MCGIVAVIHADTSSDSAVADLHDALYLLQHRGQDACGIATCGSGGRIYQCKGNGLVSKVFNDEERITDLPGFMGVGHLRYPTMGTASRSEAQPLFVNSPYGIYSTDSKARADNGNLLNSLSLKKFLDQEAHRHINTDSDSEILLNVMANELNESGKARVNAEDCFKSLERTYKKCEGSWACTAMIAGLGLIGFRDPYGIRPIVIGSRTVEGGTDYMIASESVALQFFGCHPEDVRDLLPGEAVIIVKGSGPEFRQVQPAANYTPDIFEYLYFARPDSIIDGINVENARFKMGEKLAATIKKELGPERLAQVDVVIPIPETSNTSARAVAKHLDKELASGFVKASVRRKLNAMSAVFNDKTVLLVDDSIVRGNTSLEICLMAREAGAKSIIFASASPPVRHSHIYGVDLASPDELIAYSKTPAEIAIAIGADMVTYQTLSDLEAACAELSPRGTDCNFESGVFSGCYVTRIPDGYFEHLERVRGRTKKPKVPEAARRTISDTIRDEDLSQAVAGLELGAAQSLITSCSQDISLHNFND